AFAGDANHTGSADAKPFSIGQAGSTTVVTVSDATYDGSTHGGSAQVTGAGGLDQGLTVSYVGRNGTVYPSSTTAPRAADADPASAAFAGDANHTGSADAKPFSIAKALATWTTNANSKTYGADDPSPLTTGSGSGFVAADGVTATYTRA